MSAALTLHSRLRILIAKAFRAEKLYASIPNRQGGADLPTAQISELANDIRAREWQKTHHALRTALNDLLDEKSMRDIQKEVSLLSRRFAMQAEETAAALEKEILSVAEATKRHEFAHVVKLSLELIRLKSRAQANKAIALELEGVLEASGKDPNELAAKSALAVAVKEGAEVVADPAAVSTNNVIAFKRRASGSRGFRG